MVVIVITRKCGFGHVSLIQIDVKFDPQFDQQFVASLGPTEVCSIFLNKLSPSLIVENIFEFSHV